MEHKMDEQMRTMVEAGQMSEQAYKQLVETLGSGYQHEEKLFIVKYRHNIVSAMSIISDDYETSGVHLFEDHFVCTMIATSKECPDHSWPDTYQKIFNENQIAVHNGKPKMKPTDSWSTRSRTSHGTNDGNVLLFQNTILSVTPYTRKRAREG
jgi:hypothetical protein